MSGLNLLAPRARLELATLRLTAGCSTIELSRNICFYFFLNSPVNIPTLSGCTLSPEGGHCLNTFGENYSEIIVQKTAGTAEKKEYYDPEGEKGQNIQLVFGKYFL